MSRVLFYRSLVISVVAALILASWEIVVTYDLFELMASHAWSPLATIIVSEGPRVYASYLAVALITSLGLLFVFHNYVVARIKQISSELAAHTEDANSAAILLKQKTTNKDEFDSLEDQLNIFFC